VSRGQFLLLALLLAQSLFLLAPQYGFYEDDYALVVPFFHTDAHQLMANIRFDITVWPTGRPLNHTLPALCGALYPWGGRLAIFSAVFLIQWVNAGLVGILARRFLSPGGAFLASCAYIVFPGDTSRLLATHVHVFGSLTLALLALVAARRAWAYALALLTLTSYESAFLVFLLARPIFRGRMRQHLLACAMVLLIPIAIRGWRGEARMLEVAGHPTTGLYRALSSLVIGPPVSLSSFSRAWAFAYQQGDWLGFALILSALLIITRCPPDGTGKNPKRLFWTGTLIWIGGYGLTLVNYPPTQIAGRLTTTHLVAAVGLAWMIASAVEFAGSKGAYRLVCLGLAACLPWLWQIQKDYAQAWKQQREFWTRLTDVCSDLREGDQVVVRGYPPQPASIRAHSWADPVVLRNIFELRDAGLHWVDDPCNPKPCLEQNPDGSLFFNSEPWYRRRPTSSPEHTLLVESGPTSMRRVSTLKVGDFDLAGRPFDTSKSPSLSRFARQELLLAPEAGKIPQP